MINHFRLEIILMGFIADWRDTRSEKTIQDKL